MDSVPTRAARHGSKASLLVAAAAGLMAVAGTARGAITWDGGGSSSWWFDSQNWTSNANGQQIPPGNSTAATDANINSGVTVEYDPVNDPFYASAGALTYPANYGPETIWRLYLSSGVAATNTLNIRSGNLTTNETGGTAQWIIGRQGTGVVNQYGGTATQLANNIDLGSNQNPTSAGTRSGTWNYYGGTLEAGLGLAADSGTGGIRLGAASSANTPADSTDGTLRIYNPASGGHVRFKNLLSAAGSTGDGSMGLVEFHYDNNDVRPVQVARGMTLNNSATQSSRLGLALETAPQTPADNGLFYIPESVGLFDIDYSAADAWAGTLTGNFFDATGANSLTEGSIVSAVGPDSFTYRWTISYSGLISWSDVNNSVVSGVTGPGTGNDIVLLGLDSTKPVPEPMALGLLGVAAVALRRRR